MKSKYWAGICYPENMIEDWEDSLYLLECPYAYCIHDKEGKEHVHFIIAFNNTTTDNNALNTLNLLSAEDKKCASTIQPVRHLLGAYQYLIHENAPKKYQYPPAQRHAGGGFDISTHEDKTLSAATYTRQIIAIIDEYNISEFYELTNSLLDNPQLLYYLRSSAYFFSKYIDSKRNQLNK